MDTIVAVWQDSLVVDVKQVRPILYSQTMCLFPIAVNNFSNIPCITSISELVLEFWAMLSLSDTVINEFIIL